MIYYSIPYNSDKNIGEYYNQFAKIVPDDSYICFVDADTIFTTYDYGSLIEEVVSRYPNVDAFTCCTNRVACKWQIAHDVDKETNDIEYHRNFGKYLKDTYGSECEDVTNKQLFSGLFLLIKKSSWIKIGGAISEGMLKVDNDIHKKLQDHKMLLYQIKGLYLYHWYRNGNRSDVSHLKKNITNVTSKQPHTKIRK